MLHRQGVISVASKVALLISFMVLTASLALHHEPWRDEVDSWLMARDASLATILEISPNMGTPVGWYYMLKPLAAIGLPFGAQQILTLFLVWLAVGFLVFQGPFSILMSLCLCLSWYLSFEYAAMSRNYTVGVLGVFALLGACSLKDSSRLGTVQWWLAWPLVCFSSVHFLALTPGLLLISYLLKRHQYVSQARLIAIHLWPVFLFALSVWLLWPTGNGQFSAQFITRFQIGNWPTASALAVFPFFEPSQSSMYLGPFVACVLLRVCAPRRFEIIALGLMVAGVNSIFVFKYFGRALRYSGVNWIILIVAVWLSLLRLRGAESPSAQLRARLLSVLVLVITVTNMSDVVGRWFQEHKYPFTDGGAVAQYLIDSNQLQEPIACATPPRCSVILGYLPGHIKFWYPGINDWGSHMFWDRTYAESNRLPAKEAFLSAKKSLHDERRLEKFLFISSQPIPNPDALQLVKVWESQGRAWRIMDENFTVYRWQSDDPNSNAG